MTALPRQIPEQRHRRRLWTWEAAAEQRARTARACVILAQVLNPAPDAETQRRLDAVRAEIDRLRPFAEFGRRVCELGREAAHLQGVLLASEERAEADTAPLDMRGARP